MPALGVQRVRGHQHIGQDDPIKQRGERGQLVGLPVHLSLPEHNPGYGIERGQQMGPGPVLGAGAAGGLPVHRDHPHPPRWRVR